MSVSLILSVLAIGISCMAIFNIIKRDCPDFSKRNRRTSSYPKMPGPDCTVDDILTFQEEVANHPHCFMEPFFKCSKCGEGYFAIKGHQCKEGVSV